MTPEERFEKIEQTLLATNQTLSRIAERHEGLERSQRDTNAALTKALLSYLRFEKTVVALFAGIDQRLTILENPTEEDGNA